jgi:asparagine N-glycosylation enzyme membrane subunit Stt3
MFFTQQRAGMLVFLIGILSIINFKSKRFWKTVLLCFVAALIIWPFISDNVALLLSIFNSKYEGTVSGSSISMRFEQLNAVFKIMQEAPFTGLGEYVDKLYRGIYASKARGYESLWFEQMAKHGIIGVFAYIVMIYYSIYKIPKKYHSKELFFISLSYWMTYTLTSTPYFRIYFLYGIIFYYIKSSEQFHGIASVSESNIENLIRG